jgi:hypothetical protein
MSPIAIDSELAAKLTSNGGQVQLTDMTGKPIGYYVSPEEFARMQKARYDQAFAEITEEGINEALADPSRYTMEEVFMLLEKR